MIFSADHIAQIKARIKTQTRRKSGRYRVGRTYSIQPGRTKKGIPDGRIRITRMREEKYLDGGISVVDAIAEGDYTPGVYETLFKNMYPDWIVRYAYTFKYLRARERLNTPDKPFVYKPRKCVDVTVNVDIVDQEGKSWKAERKIRMHLKRNWKPEK